MNGALSYRGYPEGEGVGGSGREESNAPGVFFDGLADNFFSLLANAVKAKVHSGPMDEEGKSQPKTHALSDGQDVQRSEANAKLEREIREGRKFNLGEAIARSAGPGVMKGESPVARMQQAEIEIEAWLRSHLLDAVGSLKIVLHRDVKASELLLHNFDQPLVVLADYCQRVLDSDYLLEELVRAADAEWGRSIGERPYFDRKGTLPDPDDPYTVESVRNALSDLLKQVAMDKRCQQG